MTYLSLLIIFVVDTLLLNTLVMIYIISVIFFYLNPFKLFYGTVSNINTTMYLKIWDTNLKILRSPQMTTDIFCLYYNKQNISVVICGDRKIFIYKLAQNQADQANTIWTFPSFMTYHRVCDKTGSHQWHRNCLSFQST